MLVCQGVAVGLILERFQKVKVYLSFGSVQSVHEKLGAEEQQILMGFGTLGYYFGLHLSFDLVNCFLQGFLADVSLLEIAQVPPIVDFLA